MDTKIREAYDHGSHEAAEQVQSAAVGASAAGQVGMATGGSMGAAAGGITTGVRAVLT